MNRVPLRAFFISLAFISITLPIRSQVSFFQPPSYSGTANVFAADFNYDGKPDLLTSDGTMNLGNGDGTFTLGTTVSVPSGFSVLAVADFNGDGKPDVLEQDTSKGALLVLLGKGDGTFQTAVSTAIGAILSALSTVDLNGDGKADVVGLVGSSLLVYIGIGDGTFASGVSYNMGVTPSSSPVLSLGDFNGDTKTDVAISVGGDNAPGEEIVFLGNGNGTFQSTPKTSPGLANLMSTATVGDFNGDGKLDLAIISPGSCSFSCGPSALFLLPGNGDGTFQVPAALFPVYGQSVIAAADLNGDGRLDLVVEQDPTVVQIYLQNSDGTFSNGNSYVMTMAATTPYGFATYTGIAISDFNHDGKPDIAAQNSVLLGDGDGSFEGIQLGSIPASLPTAAVVGDFENNSRIDAAAVSGTSLYILRNNGQGALSLLHTYTLQQPGQGIVTADFNGDGNLDLVVFGTDSNTQDWNYSVLLGNGDGSFQLPVYYPQGVAAGSSYGYSHFAVADFNNDHKPDIALITGTQTQPLTILLSNGDGTFAVPTYYFDGNANSFVIADYNSDGNLDIAVSSPPNGTGILYGKGDGTFQPIAFPISLNGFYGFLTADINNDGKADLIGSQIALGNGDGTFTLLPPLQNSASGIADFNGDGKLDLFVTLFSSLPHPISTGVELGNGDGTFGPFTQIPTNGGLLPAALFADMNGDGRTDMVFLWDVAGAEPFRVGGLSVLRNTTPQGFELYASDLSPSPMGAGNSATSTVMAFANFGFNTPPTLSCTGLPSGASCTFNPLSIANSFGKSTLTVTTNTSTAVGIYPIQVTGTARGITNSTALYMNVQAVAPDFSFGPTSGSPTSQTIAAGQTANFNLNVAASGSFTGTVNFICAITPTVTPAPTCNVPSSVQISSSGTQSISISVATTAFVTSGISPQNGFPLASMPLPWTLMLLGTTWLWVRNRKRIGSLVLPIVMLGLMMSLVACGGSGGSGSSSHTMPRTPAGTYTVTITASSGSLSHNTALQVIVQ